ncbi:MAG: Tyrosine recombinase XerC [Petrimonas sp.]|uniref:site-specific integrase n=1 Tax=Dysgonomonadaceae TaxID=2005520 RepID=UPI00041FDB36|nr:site-specific integrase [Dysgonomonas capnocytophagoides]
MANLYYPYIKPNYVAGDGKTPLYVRYNYNRTKRTLISTGYTIKPDHWDDKKRWIKRACPEFEEIDSALTKITSKLGEILTYAKDNGIDPIVDFVLLELEKNREYEQRSNRVNMFDTLELYIEEKKGKVSADQIKDYKSLRKHLTNFKEHSSQPVTFRNLNLKFYNEFMDYLFYKAEKPDGTIGLLTNSAGKVIRLLKGFVNYQIAKGTIPAVDLSHFKVVEEETDAIYLSENELAKIYNLKLSDDKELEEIRDIFIVGCYTGLRYSDLSTLSPEHIDVTNETISLKQRKVHKAVIIPMIDYVPNILEKYNYDLPKVPSYKFNERLKELGKKAKLKQKVEVVRKKGNLRVKEVHEKWEMMSSHTCRRSFCTNMYLSGFPAEELMRISGHKSPAAFMRYIKVDNMQAANRLKELRQKLSKQT